MKIPNNLLGVLLFISFTILECNASENNSSNDDQAIRDTRLRFNQAILDQDVTAISNFLAPDYHIITGRSQQSHGIEAERESWASIFAADPKFMCKRDTRELRINHGWGLAEELGDWNCFFTVDNNAIHASGVYAAKWQRAVDGMWLIQSEVFTTLGCKGNAAGCQRPEAIERR